jgi:hypothetical protein
MNYVEQLKHPLWQKKRLEVMQRDNFGCKSCGMGDQQLHVHHKYYKKNTLLWEYPDESLITLCGNCHKEADALREQLKERIGCLPLHFINHIMGYAKALEMRDMDDDELIHFSNYDEIEGLAQAFCLNSHEILEFSDLDRLAEEVEKDFKLPKEYTITNFMNRTYSCAILISLYGILRSNKK